MAFICLGCLLAESWLAWRFSSVGTFDYYNILFDSDASEGWTIRAHGWSEHLGVTVQLPNYIHPLINYLTMPFFRVAAKLLTFVDPAISQAGMRETMALFVSPACVSAAAFLLGLAMTWLGFSAGAAAGAALLYAVSYSNLVFGADPDHFSMGALSIAMLLAWLAFWLRKPPPLTRRGHYAWVALALFAASVTITNLAVAVVVRLCLEMRGEGALRRAVRTGAEAAGIILGVILVAAILGKTILALGNFGIGPVDPMGANPGFVREVEKAQSYLELRPDRLASKLMDTASVSVQALVGAGIGREPALRRAEPDIVIALSPRHWPWALVATGVAMLCLLLLGIYTGLNRRAPEFMQRFSIACAALLAGNMLLHSVYGRVPFLYTQHWLIALVFFLTVGLAQMAKRFPASVRPVLSVALPIALLGTVFVWNAGAIAQTLQLSDSIVKDLRQDRPSAGP